MNDLNLSKPVPLSDLNLRGRVAIVTGASKGIGAAVSKRLAWAGARVVVNYLKDAAGARRVVEEIGAAGGEALAVRGDVRDLREMENVARRAHEAFGGIDILICNAGVWEGAPADQLEEELWERSIDINLKGTWTTCRAAAPLLKTRGWGRVVVISSTAGQRGEAGYSNYAAAKGGQISFVKSLAVEFAPHGVTVNAVAPGWVETEMTAAEFRDPRRRAEIERAIPLGRVASADDVALPVLFLCSDWARHVTGEVLNVNGGSVLCG